MTEAIACSRLRGSCCDSWRLKLYHAATMVETQTARTIHYKLLRMLYKYSY